MTESFAADLMPIDRQSIERGDAVYEVIRFGTKPEDTKYKKWRVLETDRGAALCEPYDGSPGEKKAERRKIQYSQLRREKPEAKFENRPRVKLVAPASEAPLPAPSKSVNAAKAAATDDQFEAWKEMGRELVGGITAEIAALTEQHERIKCDLDAVDARHRRTIEELEQELLEARRAHEEDRALAAARRDAIGTKLERAKERLQGIRSMLGDGDV